MPREEEVMEGTGLGVSVAAHACPPPHFGEQGVQHNPRQPGCPWKSWERGHKAGSVPCDIQTQGWICPFHHTPLAASLCPASQQR